jgi:aminopeptidase N
MLRATIVGSMIYGEHPATISEARLRYATQDINNMDAELRGLILITEVRHGDTKKAIDTLLGIYKTSASVDVKQDICDAVCSTRDTAQIERLLDLLKDTTIIRTQDTAMWYMRLLNNRDGRTLAWQWQRQNWDWIKITFGGDKSYDTFPRVTAQILATREQLGQYMTFFEPMLSDTGLKRAISVGINDIEARVRMIESDKQAVEQRLLEL